ARDREGEAAASLQSLRALAIAVAGEAGHGTRGHAVVGGAEADHALADKADAAALAGRAILAAGAGEIESAGAGIRARAHAIVAKWIVHVEAAGLARQLAVAADRAGAAEHAAVADRGREVAGVAELVAGRVHRGRRVRRPRVGRPVGPCVASGSIGPLGAGIVAATVEEEQRGRESPKRAHERPP